MRTHAMTKYNTATMMSGKNGSKVRLRMMSLAFVKSCTAI
jgi:hypothetical protein